MYAVPAPLTKQPSPTKRGIESHGEFSHRCGFIRSAGKPGRGIPAMAIQDGSVPSRAGTLPSSSDREGCERRHCAETPFSRRRGIRTKDDHDPASHLVSICASGQSLPHCTRSAHLPAPNQKYTAGPLPTAITSQRTFVLYRYRDPCASDFCFRRIPVCRLASNPGFVRFRRGDPLPKPGARVPINARHCGFAFPSSRNKLVRRWQIWPTV